MKKNTMMRLASFLLIAVLITTSAISGTYAKYVTSDSARDTARVAKWGVELQVVGNLFGTSYKDNIVKSAEDTDDKITVQAVDWSTAASDVVAPGTQNTGEGFTFSLNGQPEVDGEIDAEMVIQNVFLAVGDYGVMIPVDSGVITEANFGEFAEAKLYTKEGDRYVKAKAWATGKSYYTLEDEAKVENSPYYPVVYTLSGTSTSTGNTSTDSLKAAADVIAAKLGIAPGTPVNATTTYNAATNKTFQSNENLTDLGLGGVTLTWAWAFDDVNDGADTILGMLENTSTGVEVVKLSDSDYIGLTEYTDYCLNSQFSIDITVTQVN